MKNVGSIVGCDVGTAVGVAVGTRVGVKRASHAVFPAHPPAV